MAPWRGGWIRLGEAINGVPIVTLVVVGICCMTFTLQGLLEIPMSNFAMSARAVVFLGEPYRLLFSAFVHLNFMHILFNVISTVTLGGGLERSIGSILMFYVVLWSAILQGCLYVVMQLVIAFITGEERHYLQQCCGFSGVLFALAVVESYSSVDPMR